MYNYVLAAALSSGIAISSIIILFALQFTNNIAFNWWGTDASSVGCEGTACRLLKIPAQGYFGPELGTFP
jgi:hypothetical protein